MAFVGAVVPACSARSENPYAELGANELTYVIPDSEDWGRPFDYCPDRVDCAPGVDLHTFRTYSWVAIDSVSADEGVGDERTIDVDVKVSRVVGGTFDESSTGTQAWGEDVERVRAVLADGYEVWAGVYPGEPHVFYFLAFDSEGRFAGVGHGAAGLLSVPLADIVGSQPSATSGRAFLEQVLADGIPPDQ
jgi:hypothetical protein